MTPRQRITKLESAMLGANKRAEQERERADSMTAQLLAVQAANESERSFSQKLAEELGDAKRALQGADQELANVKSAARASVNRLKRELLQAHRRIARLEGRLDIAGPDSMVTPDVDVPALTMEITPEMQRILHRKEVDRLEQTPEADSWLDL